jgi:hypothetical protein
MTQAGHRPPLPGGAGQNTHLVGLIGPDQAPLEIWSFSTLLSLGMFLAEYRNCKRTARAEPAPKAGPIGPSIAAGGAV